MKIALIVIAVIALLLLIDAVSRRRLENLRRAGVYPQEGHETPADVDRLIQLNKKIEAIKVYRTLHNVGLKDAKEAVERRQAELKGGG